MFGNPLDYFILKNLYKNKGLDKKEAPKKYSKIEKLKSINNRKQFGFDKFFFGCFRLRKEKRLITNGLQRAFRELDVEKFIRMQK